MTGMANAANAMFGAASQTLTDAVGQGYRVINEYLAQGQRQAEALRFPDWSSVFQGAGGAAPGAASAQQELQQQLFRRLMQYGMDFAALYFEMLSRGGWPAPPGGAAAGTPAAWTEAFARAASPAAWAGAAAPASSGTSAGSSSSSGATPGAPPWPFAMPFPWWPAAPGAPGAAASAPEASAASAAPHPGAAPAAAGAGDSPERVFVSVISQRRVESVLELRRGGWGALTAHALRPEGHDAPAIRGVSIEARPEESALRVSVEVPADQPPGVYNGMIVDTVSNLPRGTLTVRVLAAGAAE